MCGDKFICIYDDGAIRTINVCVWKRDDYNRFVLLFFFANGTNSPYAYILGCSRMISMKVQLLHSRTFEYIWLIHKMMLIFLSYFVFTASILGPLNINVYIYFEYSTLYINKSKEMAIVHIFESYLQIYPPRNIQNMKFINLVEKKRIFTCRRERHRGKKIFSFRVGRDYNRISIFKYKR